MNLDVLLGSVLSELNKSDIYYGNSVRAYAVAVAIAIGVTLGLDIFKRVIARRVRKLAKFTTTRIDDLLLHVIAKTRFLTMIAIGIYAGSVSLTLTPIVDHLVGAAIIIIVLLQIGTWASSAITFSLKDYRKRKTEEGDPSSLGAAGLLAAVAKLVAWSVVLLLVLDNLGVDITALVAGLGISGIALALAVQGTLKDLFASVSIMLDKPFEVGDSIKVGATDSGTVEYIGIKTTRVRAPSGEELVFSNADLLNSRIRNFKRLKDRRAVITISTSAKTPVDKVEQIPTILQQIIESQEHARFHRSSFTEIGKSALVFEAVYFMTDNDYSLFLTTQQTINVEILRRFSEQGIDLA